VSKCWDFTAITLYKTVYFFFNMFNVAFSNNICVLLARMHLKWVGFTFYQDMSSFAICPQIYRLGSTCLRFFINWREIPGNSDIWSCVGLKISYTVLDSCSGVHPSDHRNILYLDDNPIHSKKAHVALQSCSLISFQIKLQC
jgi:hypothetical protein